MRGLPVVGLVEDLREGGHGATHLGLLRGHLHHHCGRAGTPPELGYHLVPQWQVPWKIGVRLRGEVPRSISP